MRVDSDNPEVVRLVTVIADEVVRGGGYIHPELVVNNDGGNLWLSLPHDADPYLEAGLDRPHPEAPELLVVPAELHIPVTNLGWVASDTRLAYSADASHLSPAQRTILDAMVDLFNTVDKVRLVGRSYAQHSLAADAELAELVSEARPGWDTRATTPEGEAADEPADSPAHTVMRSRLRSEMGEGDEGPMGFFMPMIDMLNHHPYGSRYERTDDGSWLIRVHHPTATEEVFVRYNKADALGVALGLGYSEPDTRFVSSVACNVTIPGLAEVRVTGVAASRRRLPAPRVARAGDGLVVSGLVLDHSRRDALARLLAMPLQSLRPDADATQVHGWTGEFIDAVVVANRDYFTRLAALCARGADDHPLRRIFGQVARRQLELLAHWA